MGGECAVESGKPQVLPREVILQEDSAVPTGASLSVSKPHHLPCQLPAGMSESLLESLVQG